MTCVDQNQSLSGQCTMLSHKFDLMATIDSFLSSRNKLSAIFASTSWYTQHPAVKINSICRGNFWESSRWISTQQVDYWPYILHSSNIGEKMGIQWSSASANYRFQESVYESCLNLLCALCILVKMYLCFTCIFNKEHFTKGPED